MEELDDIEFAKAVNVFRDNRNANYATWLRSLWLVKLSYIDATAFLFFGGHSCRFFNASNKLTKSNKIDEFVIEMNEHYVIL